MAFPWFYRFYFHDICATTNFQTHYLTPYLFLGACRFLKIHLNLRYFKKFGK